MTTWRGVIPIDLSMPRSRRRSRTLSTTVLKTPSAATVDSSSESTDEKPITVTAKSLIWDVSERVDRRVGRPDRIDVPRDVAAAPELDLVVHLVRPHDAVRRELGEDAPVHKDAGRSGRAVHDLADHGQRRPPPVELQRELVADRQPALTHELRRHDRLVRPAPSSVRR